MAMEATFSPAVSKVVGGLREGDYSGLATEVMEEIWCLNCLLVWAKMGLVLQVRCMWLVCAHDGVKGDERDLVVKVVAGL